MIKDTLLGQHGSSYIHFNAVKIALVNTESGVYSYIGYCGGNLMNLSDLEEQRKILLLKKSEGKATEEDLKQLVRVLDLINKAEPSIASEINSLREKDKEKDLDFSKK